MRWGIGLVSLGLATLFWVASLLADPHTAWGIEHEHLRPGVARIGIRLGLVSLMFLGAAVLTLSFGEVLGEADRQRRRMVPFAMAIAFLAVTDVWRLLWVWSLL